MTNPKQANILQWNCRGIKPNYEEIKCLIADYNSTIICLQETFLKESDNVRLKGYNDYNVTSTSIDGKAIGGSSILVKGGTPHEVLQLNTGLQAVAVKATLHRTITLCSVYIPPSYPLRQGELDQLIDQLPTPYLLLGDFNGHSDLWGSVKTDRKGKIMESAIEKFDLCLFNDKSITYIHPATGSMSTIDLSMSSPVIFMDFQWRVHDDQCGSDHFPIFIDINRPMPEERTPKWQLHKAKWSAFSDLCSASINRESFENIEDPPSSFAEILIDIASQTIPKSSTNSHNKHKPWFNIDCKEAIRSRQNALHKFKHQPTTSNLNKYKKARAKARRIVKESKRNSWKQYVSKLNSRTPAKKVWDMIRKISGKQLNTSKHLNNPDGSKCTEKHDIVNLLAGEFEKNSSSNHYSQKFQTYKNNIEKHKLNFDSDNIEDYNIPFNITELHDSLTKCHDTATGPDDIHYQFLKHLPYESQLVLLDILIDIWRTGNIPDSWREATVIPIPKPGKDATSPTNYRPISLTSCLCKTMERVINARLVWFLEKNNLISKHQSGFRQGRSTIDQLVQLESYIRDAFVRGDHVVSVFFDLEKAYDTTWKYGILRDLHKLGLKGRMPIFIKNFLSDRVFRVRLGSTLSELHNQEMGVPQGSILSVTLFLLKINSLAEVVKARIDKSLFVDDFSVSYSSSSMVTIERRMQSCLNQIEQWADENGFRFSKTKTVCMHFCNQRKLHLDPELKINGTPIPIVQQTKYLGLIFDSKLNFKAHIDYLRQKCQKSLNLLKVVSKMDWGADRTVLIRLYRSLIRSKLDYGCIVYSSARKTYLKRLQPIQNQGLRLCLGAFRTSPMQSLYVEANEAPLHLRWEKLSLQYALKLKSNPNIPAYERTFEPRNVNFYTSKPKAIKSFGIRIKDAFPQVCQNTDLIAPFVFPPFPPWKIVKPEIDLSLRRFKKCSTDELVFQSKFGELREKYEHHKAVYTDGSKVLDRVAAAAMGGGVKSQIRLPDGASIYTAELQALKMAFNLIEHSTDQQFIIFTDSLSSLMALQGNKLDHPCILEILEAHAEIARLQKSVVLAWVPSHVGIKGNEEVDTLAKEALNLNITNIEIPYTDFKTKINSYIRNEWQTLWDTFPDNKLHEIKPIVGIENNISIDKRRDEIVLARARIGHAYITHAYLLKTEDMPWCIPCDCPYTVKHILNECIDYANIRNKYFNVPNLRTLFEKVETDKILDFLKEMKLFKLF
jgi:ribonuclease HI